MSRYTAPRRPLLIALLVAGFLLYRYGFNAPDSTHAAARGASKGSRPRIAMISMTTRETPYDHIAISNKFDYAAKHGYTMLFDFKGPRGVWDKLTDAEKAIKEHKYDWLWWLDYDILITNTTVKLENIISDALAEAALEGKDPNGIDLIVTPDCFPLNAGSMIFRTTDWILDFFQEVWRCGRETKDGDRSFNEQECMRDMIKDNVVHAGEKSIRIKQWKMNAFPEEIPCYDDDQRKWEPGMFVVHFAGAWAHMKDKEPVQVLMEKYVQMVV